jgi:hypothetical protein
MRKFIELGNYIFAIKNIAYVQRLSNTIIAVYIEGEQTSHNITFKSTAAASEAYDAIRLVLKMYSGNA